jgi:hypothetical protein
MRKCFVLKTGMSNRHETTAPRFPKYFLPLFTGFQLSLGSLQVSQPPAVVVPLAEMRDGGVCKAFITRLIRYESCLIVSDRATYVSRRTSLPQSREPTPAKNKNYQTNPFEIFQFAHGYWRFSSSTVGSQKKRTHSAIGFTFRISNFWPPPFSLAACRLEGFLFISRQPL